MRKFIVIVVATLASYGVMAQGGTTLGLIFDRDIISASSMTSLSQRNTTGTARSTGMGGAFTSLGADMASLAYNPAGFGMYQRNEVSMTFGLGITQAKNYGASSPSSGNTTTQFTINNTGGSFQVFEGTGALLALNFAFGYNKVADYNYNIAYTNPSSLSSAADAFADIANNNGLGINSDGKICDANGYYDYYMDPYFWTTALAYKGGLINRGSNGWWPDEIGPDAVMAQRTRLKSRGSAGEFSFALGGNISNILYFGVSLDLQSLSRAQTLYYDENIDYANGATPDPTAYPYQLREFQLGQAMHIDGTGIGAKFGVVVRPTNGLRIGLAVHTPTYYSLAYRYEASLSSAAYSAGSNPDGYDVGRDGYIYAEEFTPGLEDIGDNRWAFITPTRLLAGISYTIGKWAIISADYQYDTFGGMRVKSAPIDYGFINETLRYNLKGVHHARAGIEVKPISMLALRVGGGYTSGILNEGIVLGEPVLNSMWSLSAGIGVRVSKVTSIDLAYQYRKEENSDYYTFYSENSQGVNASGLYGLDLLRHNIALTFAFRF